MPKALPKPLPVLGRRKIKPESIEAALKEVNGRAYSHAITEFRQVERTARLAEEALAERDLPIKYRDGARLTCAPSGPGKAYARYSSSVASTEICLERIRGTWCLVSVEKCSIHAEFNGTFSMELPREAIGQILVRTLKGIIPRDAPEGSFERMCLGSFIHEISQVALPEDPSNHARMNAVAIVDGLISSGYSRSVP